MNRGLPPNLYFVRSKEQVELDFLVQLPNQQFIAIEVKTTPTDLTTPQLRLLQTLKLPILEHWIVSFTGSTSFANARLVLHDALFDHLTRLMPS
jgi:hypothetical protein